MAKLKFGSVDVNVEVPRLEPQLVTQPSDYEFIQKLIAMLPKPKEIEPQDLTYLERAISSQGESLIKHNERLLVLELAEKPKACECKSIALPEIKQITHVKDVSPDVLKQCESMIEKARTNHQLDINSLKTHIKIRANINLWLSGILLITIFLHLI